ncbi:ABC transporter permease [Maribacter sp. X9]|uniref:ABC transporter permease n=1 Tax=Maribacter sp. X9 TaxID=3402159 RepID=UPI003AF3E258
MLVRYALRNIRKRIVLNLIKIVGLSLGFCGVLFIALFLKKEVSYDKGHDKANRIYRLTTTNPDVFEGAHFARITDAKKVNQLPLDIPDIEALVRMMPLRDKLLLKDDQYYAIDQAFAVDDTFFKLFDVSFYEGNSNLALANPGSAVISKSLAHKVFGDKSPMGKIISLPPGHYNTIETSFTIKGVMEDFAQESHMHPELLIMPGADAISGWAYVYTLLKANTDFKEVIPKISQKLNDLYGLDRNSETEIEAHLMPLNDIHLTSNLLREIEANGSTSNIYLMAIAGLILLFISLSNFTSLNLGMAAYLEKFLALNQILGSSNRITMRYFLMESSIILFCSLVLVLLGTFQLNRFILNHYQSNFLESNLLFALGVMLCFFILGLLAGVYPVVKKGFRVVTLGNRIKQGSSVKTHKVLLVTQFAMAIVLLVGVIVITRQTNYALGNSMGATKDNVISIPYVHADVQKDFQVFKAELLKEGAIRSVSAMMSPPGGETNDMFPFTMEDAPDTENKFIGIFSCDYSFANVFELPFLSGKNFTEKSIDQNGNGEYIINATALNYLGFQDPHEVLDKDFALISPVDNVVLPEGKIIGVVKDFHLSGLQTKVAPLVLFKRENSWLENIAISYEPSLKTTAIAAIEKTWEEMFPNYPLSYYPVSTLYENVYKTELVQKNLILIFALIAILVSAMGVLGLSLMVAQRRFKEIGIRKVNGATISEILVLLNTDFLKWIIIAFIFAVPIAYLGANKWLESFAYKIELNISMFLLAGGITIFTTMLTISWNSYRAAKQNPVNSLRTE